MEIIAICNQKGGSGKTTTAINLSAALALNGKKILLIDFDPQAHATMGLNVESKLSIYDVLSNISPNKCSLEDIIIQLDTNLFLAPSSIILSAIEQELSDEIGREARLFNIIATIKDKYDFIIIDCPPNLGFLTVNAMRASNSALIPVEASRFSVDGVAKLTEIINLINERLNHKIDAKVLITIFDSRLRHSFEILDRVKRTYKEKVLSTIIHTNVKLKESQAHGTTVFKHDKYCRGAKDYFTLSLDLIKNKENSGNKITPAQPVTMERISSTLKNITQKKLKEFHEVTFSFNAPTARSVSIAGDFNNWAIDENSRLNNESGVWTKKVSLSIGNYQYRFVIDGQWQEDPTNPRTAINSFGELNSVLEIGNGPV